MKNDYFNVLLHDQVRRFSVKRLKRELRSSPKIIGHAIGEDKYSFS
jgi:hypothetical protein